MIDIESEVITRIGNAVKKEFASAEISSDETRTPTAFPSITVIENDNYSDKATADSGSNENCAVVAYEINVYSNKAVGRKSECKSVAALIDAEMLLMGFARTMSKPISASSAALYRIVSRYTAKVSKNKLIYRR